MLILDEPTSNLDIIGEVALLKAIATAKARKATVIVIAHRPKILKFTDKVLVVQDGQQMTYGPRDEVLAKLQANQAVEQTEAAGGKPAATSTTKTPGAGSASFGSMQGLQIASPTQSEPKTPADGTETDGLKI